MEFVPLSDCELHLVETAKTKEQWIVSTDVGDMIGIFEGTGEEDQKEYGEPDLPAVAEFESFSTTYQSQM